MRKFNVRWWAGPVFVQWRYMTACGDYAEPFWWFPRKDWICAYTFWTSNH